MDKTVMGWLIFLKSASVRDLVSPQGLAEARLRDKRATIRTSDGRQEINNNNNSPRQASAKGQSAAVEPVACVSL
jgi:hypothetical protein